MAVARTSFADKSFSERFATMGDPAEDAFRRWAPTQDISFADYGLKRPPFKRFYDLPEMVKATPDFVCEGPKRKKFFVECKGTGGRVVKIKHETMDSIEPWANQMPLFFFVFDSTNNRCCMIHVDDLTHACMQSKSYKFPNDGKEYYSISTLKFTWEDLGALDDSKKEVLGY